MPGLHDLIVELRALIPILIIPPPSLLWAIFLGLAIRRSRPRWSAALVGGGLAALYILSMPAVGGALIASLESNQPKPSAAAQPGAIIVLGGDGDRTTDLLVKAEPGPLSLQRLAGAAAVARATNLPVLITGGNISRNEPAVSDLMAKTFTDAFGLPVAWRETRSKTTCENARYSAEMLRQAGISSALLVTHAWHMPRALLSFEQAGFPVVAAPLYGDLNEIHGVADFVPHANAWMRSYYAIHEWIGLLAYRMGACRKIRP